MKYSKRIFSLLLACMVLLGAFAAGSAAAPQSDSVSAAVFLKQLGALTRKYPVTERDTAPNRLLVQTASDTALRDDFGASLKVEGWNRWHVFQYGSKAELDAAEAAFLRQPGVKLVKRASAVTLIAPIVEEGSGTNEIDGEHMSWGPAMVKSDLVNSAIADRDLPDVIVAVLDTGIDRKHPYYLLNRDRVVNLSGSDYDFEDGFGHGTHCAGIVCDNSLPNVKVASFKVLDDWGWGDDFYTAACIYAAADSGANVISMSLRFWDGDTTVFRNAIKYAISKGVTVVSAAGNESEVTRYPPGNVAEGITVSAINKDGTPAIFSNYGALVDVAAPGGYAFQGDYSNSINSTVPRWADPLYQKMAGTSMAAPCVAAAAATVMALYPNYKPGDVQAAIKNTAARPAGWDPIYGDGILDYTGFLTLPEKGARTPGGNSRTFASYFAWLTPVGDFFVNLWWEFRYWLYWTFGIYW